MARIDAILGLVKNQGASDPHLTTGSPPVSALVRERTAAPADALAHLSSKHLPPTLESIARLHPPRSQAA